MFQHQKQRKTILWVIGSGGMLGSSILRAQSGNVEFEVIPTPKLPWGNLSEIEKLSSEIFTELLLQAKVSGTGWGVIWAAGSGVVGVKQEVLDSEVEQFSRILWTMQNFLSQNVLEPGTLFFSSSAGGVYGGSGVGPFTESTIPLPISPYGEARLAMEELARNFGQKTSTKVIIGRIANLYGPGQDLSKPQGLISQLVRSQFTPKPVSIFVPLDTRRDYIYVDDCAQLVLDCISEVNAQPQVKNVYIKILCTGHSTTIGALLGSIKGITKRRANVLVGSSPLRKQQALDLTLRSENWPHLSAGNKTTLNEGIANTVRDVVSRIQDAQGM